MVVQLDEPEKIYLPRKGEEEGDGKSELQGKSGIRE